MKVVRWLLAGGVPIVLGWLVYFAAATATMRYPIEYREGASQVAVEILLEGGNPFVFEYQPLGMNNYGIGYTLAVYPFALLFGNTLLVHRIVTLAFLLLSGLLVLQPLLERNRDVWLSLACALLLIIPLTGRAGMGAFPSAMGACLFLAATLVPWRRGFDTRGLVLSAALSLLAFYTKPYFLLAFGIVAAYVFLFVSKRKGLWFTLCFGAAFVLVFLPVRHVFKLYFVNTLFGNLANVNRSAGHVIDQLIELLVEFWPAAVLSLLAIGLSAGDRRSAPRLDLTTLNRPLISVTPDYWLFCLGCSALAFILVLGSHIGSYMAYAYQLMLPPLVLWLSLRLGGRHIRLAVLAAPLLLLNLAGLSGLLLNPRMLEQRDSPEWARLYAYVDCSANILNSPVIASALVECGRLPVDSGQTEYYFRLEQPYPRLLVLAPEYSAVKRVGREYKESIAAALLETEYDRAMLTSIQWLYGFAQSELTQQYDLVETIVVDMPQSGRTWPINIWEPVQP